MAKKTKKVQKPKKKAAKPSRKPAARKTSFGLQPVGDKVLVRPQEVETKTASGIIIPDTVKKEKMMTGVVVAVGTGRVSETGTRIPLSVSVGDTIYFSRGWDEDGSKFPWKGEDYYLVSESDIKAVIQ